MNDGRNVSTLAALIGDPTRATVLTALIADRALTATELAQMAAVAKPTISSHLDKLLRGGLLTVEKQGRHKYFRLAGKEVAATLESLMGLAVHTGALRRPDRRAEPALCRARACYDHLAGELGVWVYQRLLDGNALVARPESEVVQLTARGAALFAGLGIDVESLRSQRRPLCRACLDWTERRHHLAGALGSALLDLITRQRWARRAADSRVLHFSTLGEAALRQALTAR
jgi:DNA-binding transcriptional ArsR family regulator